MKKNKREKLALNAALFTLCVSLYFNIDFLLGNNNISAKQAENIAYGIALKECITKKTSEDCVSNLALNASERFSNEVDGAGYRVTFYIRKSNANLSGVVTVIMKLDGDTNSTVLYSQP